MKRLILLLILAICIPVRAQTGRDTTYRVKVSATASPVISLFKSSRYPGGQDNIALGYGFFLRGMWHPGRMLAIGFLTGYMSLSRDELLAEGMPGEEPIVVTAELTAIPLQVAVTMEKFGVEVGLGMGPYLMVSTIGGTSPAHGSRMELGITFFGSYTFPIGYRLYLAPELKGLYLSYRGIISWMPSLTLRYDIFNY